MAAQMATSNIRDNFRRPDCVGALFADSVCEAMKLLVMSGIENYTVMRRAALLLARPYAKLEICGLARHGENLRMANRRHNAARALHIPAGGEQQHCHEQEDPAGMLAAFLACGQQLGAEQQPDQ